MHGEKKRKEKRDWKKVTQCHLIFGSHVKKGPPPPPALDHRPPRSNCNRACLELRKTLSRKKKDNRFMGLHHITGIRSAAECELQTLYG